MKKDDNLSAFERALAERAARHEHENSMKEQRQYDANQALKQHNQCLGSGKLPPGLTELERRRKIHGVRPRPKIAGKTGVVVKLFSRE